MDIGKVVKILEVRPEPFPLPHMAPHGVPAEPQPLKPQEQPMEPVPA